MYYFAYGSNMSSMRLKSRIQSAKTLGVARLKNYQLKFHKIGNDGSAKCNIVRSTDDKQCVYGVIYELPNDEIKQLDKIEGLGHGYEHMQVELLLKDNHTQTAKTYIALKTAPRLLPFHWYKFHVVFGAREHGLPPHYINAIDKVKSIADENKLRHQVELSIYQ